MSPLADRNEARREVEGLLGPDGSRELAEAVLAVLDDDGVSWPDAPTAVVDLTELEWSSVLDRAVQRVQE